MMPAFLRVAYAPRLPMVLSAFAERVSDTVLLSSGTNTFRFWRFAERRTLPQGLNCVARVRFEYRPPIKVDFPVTAHSRAIVGIL